MIDYYNPIFEDEWSRDIERDEARWDEDYEDDERDEARREVANE